MWIDAPLNDSQHELGTVNVMSHSSCETGIQEIVLLVNGQVYRKDPSPDPGASMVSIVQTWVPPAEGRYTLQVIAYTEGRTASNPATVRVTVGAPAVTPKVIASGEITPTSAEPAKVSPTPAGPPTSTPTAAPEPTACVLDAAFVSDVTMPDDTQMAPGQSFDKVWCLRNTGNCAWKPGYQLVFISGDSMGAPAAVAVPTTPPDGTADIGVTMNAPSAPGTYTGQWRMTDSSGQPFGTAVQVVIIVPGSPTRTPTPTPIPVLGAQINFWVDSDHVNAGQCTTLHWDVEGVQAVHVDGAGVAGRGSKQLCLCQDETHNLDATLTNGQHEYRSVTIHVSGTCEEAPPPAPAPGPADTAGPEITDFHESGDPIYTSYPGGCKPVEVTISARITDPSGVDRVRLRYRVGGGDWDAKPMNAVGGDRYEVTLAGPAVPSAVEYTIQAKDNLGNQSDSPHGKINVKQCSP
ncbi:MAG: NBR1-Ig-like domain-containing protein [Anaerolineae bacterium]